MKKELEALENWLSNSLIDLRVQCNEKRLTKDIYDNNVEKVKRDYNIIKQALTPPTADEIVKEFQKTRTYETVVYRDCGDFALLNDKNKGHYELSNIYCIVSKSRLDFPFGTPLNLAHKITSFFIHESESE